MISYHAWTVLRITKKVTALLILPLLMVLAPFAVAGNYFARLYLKLWG